MEKLQVENLRTQKSFPPTATASFKKGHSRSASVTIPKIKITPAYKVERKLREQVRLQMEPLEEAVPLPTTSCLVDRDHSQERASRADRPRGKSVRFAADPLTSVRMIGGDDDNDNNNNNNVERNRNCWSNEKACPTFTFKLPLMILCLLLMVAIAFYAFDLEWLAYCFIAWILVSVCCFAIIR